jgi:hypothetical protein
MFKILALINKVILPSFSKQQMDLAKAKKWQMAIIGYRYYVCAKVIAAKNHILNFFSFQGNRAPSGN